MKINGLEMEIELVVHICVCVIENQIFYFIKSQCVLLYLINRACLLEEDLILYF